MFLFTIGFRAAKAQAKAEAKAAKAAKKKTGRSLRGGREAAEE